MPIVFIEAQYDYKNIDWRMFFILLMNNVFCIAFNLSLISLRPVEQRLIQLETEFKRDLDLQHEEGSRLTRLGGVY